MAVSSSRDMNQWREVSPALGKRQLPLGAGGAGAGGRGAGAGAGGGLSGSCSSDDGPQIREALALGDAVCVYCM